MSCGTCPASAQPTTRPDGTAPTPGALLWSTDIGAWYRRQRARGEQPAITIPATSSAPAPEGPNEAPAISAAWRARARGGVIQVELGKRIGNSAQDPTQIVAWIEPRRKYGHNTPLWQRPVVWFMVRSEWGQGNSTNRYYVGEDGGCRTSGEGATFYPSAAEAEAALERQRAQVRASTTSLLLCPRCGEELRETTPQCALCAGGAP